MIRKLSKKDKDALMTYLRREKAFNFFILSDLERHGFDAPFLELWAQISEAGEYLGVLLRYFENYILYASGNFDSRGFLGILQRDQQAMALAGKKTVIDTLAGKITFKTRTESYFAQMETLRRNPAFGKYLVEVAKMADANKILALRNCIEEFGEAPLNADSLKNLIASKEGRYYYIRDKDRLVSMAASTLETEEMAMLGSICTHPDYRRKGFATLCVTRLCEGVLKANKHPCLFYSNPDAGALYRKIGFHEIGLWTLLILR